MSRRRQSTSRPCAYTDASQMRRMFSHAVSGTSRAKWCFIAMGMKWGLTSTIRIYKKILYKTKKEESFLYLLFIGYGSQVRLCLNSQLNFASCRCQQGVHPSFKCSYASSNNNFHQVLVVVHDSCWVRLARN